MAVGEWTERVARVVKWRWTPCIALISGSLASVVILAAALPRLIEPLAAAAPRASARTATELSQPAEPQMRGAQPPRSDSRTEAVPVTAVPVTGADRATPSAYAALAQPREEEPTDAGSADEPRPPSVDPSRISELRLERLERRAAVREGRPLTEPAEFDEQGRDRSTNEE